MTISVRIYHCNYYTSSNHRQLHAPPKLGLFWVRIIAPICQVGQAYYINFFFYLGILVPPENAYQNIMIHLQMFINPCNMNKVSHVYS